MDWTDWLKIIPAIIALIGFIWGIFQWYKKHEYFLKDCGEVKECLRKNTSRSYTAKEISTKVGKISELRCSEICRHLQDKKFLINVPTSGTTERPSEAAWRFNDHK